MQAQQSPWFWIEMIGLLLLAIISVAAIIAGLTAPHEEGIEQSDQTFGGLDRLSGFGCRERDGKA